VLQALLALRPEGEGGRFEALWRFWRGQAFEPLVRAVGDAARARKALAGAAGSLPADDGGNEAVFRLWHRLDCSELAGVIEGQARKASSLELDALFGLVQGDAARYLDMEDPEGELFCGAFHLATPAMRQRINLTVAKAQVERLTLAYRRAMLGEEKVDLEQLKRGRLFRGRRRGHRRLRVRGCP